MSKFSLFQPVVPVHLNQGFGENAEYYAKFHDAYGNPYQGHDGLDYMAYHGQPVYSPIDGVASYSTDDRGGQGVTIFTDAYEYSGGTCWFSILHWHLIGDTDPQFPAPIPLNGVRTSVKAGDLIGYANNTGAPYESSGDHLHLGVTPVDIKGKTLFPKNGFSGRIDPIYYMNGYAAKDAQKVLGNLTDQVSLYARVIALLKGLVDNTKSTG